MATIKDAREDFMYDVYNILDFLPTNNEANRIIESFDMVTSSIEQEPILDKVRAEIEEHCELAKENHCRYCSYCNSLMGIREILEIIDKRKGESEDKE